MLPELLDLWFKHLSDNINSVREHSAMALGRVVTVFEAETIPRVKEYLKANLMKAKEQKEDSKKNANLQNETQFGVAKQIIED